MKVRVLKRTQMVLGSLEDVFQFFSNPRAVEILTPSSMQFRLLTEDLDSIEDGVVLDYRFRLYSVPIRWQIRIESVDPPNSFVDVQENGPFAHWKHTQSFIAAGANATEVRDRFEFALPYGRVGEFAYRSYVKALIRQLFEYRANKMDVLMHPNPPRKPAKVQVKPAPTKSQQ